jgi:hypothetical protein
MTRSTKKGSGLRPGDPHEKVDLAFIAEGYTAG